MKTALYRHFDQSGELLYVGISISAASRLEQHMRGSAWSREITRVDVQHFSERQQALAAEKAAIISENPIWNKVHKGYPARAATGKKTWVRPVREWTEADIEQTLAAMEKSTYCIEFVISNSYSFDMYTDQDQCVLQAAATSIDSSILRKLNPVEIVRTPKKYSSARIITFLSWEEVDDSTCLIKAKACTPQELDKQFCAALKENVGAFNTAYADKFKPAIARYQQALAQAQRTNQ